MTVNAELRIACGMLAALALITSQILLDPPLSMMTFLEAMDDGPQSWLGWAMMGHCVLLILSLILRCRLIRIWGLGIGCISWLALAMALLNAWATLKLVLIGVVVAVFYLAVLMSYVQKKPRCGIS